MLKPDDAELLRAIATKRDAAAFAELYEQLGQAAYGLALRITHNPDLAEEAVQDAMLYIWRKAAAFRGDGSVRAWALRIVANASLKLIRDQKRSKANAEFSEMNPPVLGEDNLAETFEQREMASAMNAALTQLPPLEQQILALYYGGNMTQQEIAGVIDLPQQRISQHIQKATDMLRSRLVQAGFAANSALLARTVIEQAICSGPAAPPGLRLKVLERVAASASQSLRTRPRQSVLRTSAKKWITLGTVAVAASAAGRVWWSLRTPAPAPAAPLQPVAQAAVAHTPFSYVCDFTSPALPKEMRIVKGSWHFVPNGGPDHKGCMEIDTDYFCVEIDVPVDNAPLKATYLTHILPPAPPDDFMCDLGWSAYRKAGTISNSGVSVKVGFGDWIESECYVSAHFIDIWAKGVRAHVNYFERIPEAHLRLYARGHQQIAKLNIREMDAAAQPDTSAYLRAIERIEPKRRTGQVLLPELQSKQPPQPVAIRFSDDFRETP